MHSLLAAAKEIPEPTRAVLYMALLGIALLGLFLIVFILLGGNWVRRLGSHRRGPSVPPDREPLRRTADKRQSTARDENGENRTTPQQSSDAPRTADTIDDDLGETRVD